MPTVAAGPPPKQPAADRADAPSTGPAWVPIAAVVGVVALSAWNSLHKSLWIDEAYSLHTAHRTLAATWHQAMHFELQPPLYFVLLNLWMRIGSPTVTWMRVLSTLCVVGCVLLLWASRPRRAPRRGLPPPLLAVVTGTVVWAAAEARPYALALFLSAWTWYFFVRILDRRHKRSWIDGALYGIGAYAGVLTFYYIGFLLAGQWLAAAMVQRGRRWVTITLAVVGIALVPWLPAVQDQMTSNINPAPGVVPQPAMRYLAGGPSISLPSAFLAGVFGDAPVLTQTSFGTAIVGAILLFVVVLRFAVPARRDPDAARSYVNAEGEGTGYGWIEPALFIALAVPAGFLLTMQWSNVVSVYPRHLVCLTPGFILLMAYWTGCVAPGVFRWCAIAAVVTAAVLTLISYERHVDVADSRGAAAYVAAHGAADEPVLVVGPEAVLAFRYYYGGADHGRAPVLGVPIDASLDIYNPRLFELRDTSQIGVRVREAGVQNRFWMVVSQGFVWRTVPADSIVTSYIRSRTTVLDSATFTNVYVIHAVKR